MLEIIQGEKQTVKPDLTSRKTQKAFDLTGFTEIEVCFKAESTIIKKLESLGEVVVVDALKGEITTDLLVAETTTLPPTEEGIIVVTVTFGAGDVRIGIEDPAFVVRNNPCL